MSVKLAARALLYDRRASRGLVGSVFRREEGRQESFVTDIAVPMVDYASGFTQKELENLDPGSYLIQVPLPDSRIITQEFEIREDGDTDLIIQVPHEGPHEWSSLQAMTGQFAVESAMTDRFTLPVDPHPSSYAELRNDPENGYALELLTTSEVASTAMWAEGRTLDELGELIARGSDVESAPKLLGNARAIEHPTFEDGDYAIFRFGHQGLLESGNEEPARIDMYPFEGVDRRYLVQRSRQGACIVSLPTPWTTRDGQVSVELLVKKHSLPDELDQSMTIGDPMVNTALGYLSMGAIHLAQRLIHPYLALEMLHEKVSYPFAATIGGYILVLGRNTSDYPLRPGEWKQWVSNLDNWFDWLPDGAILHATLLLMDESRDLTAAREALMRAYARGLPYFTFGLKYLLDGLRFFASAGDAEATERLATLEAIAARTDPGLPFLSVTLSNRWRQGA